MEHVNELLGLHTENLLAYQMAARAFVVFFASLILIRIGGIRTLGKQSAFDTMTLLLMGAILARSIVTTSSFWGALLAVLVIMLLQRLVAWLTFKSRLAGKYFKGRSMILMKDGKKITENLAKSHISDEDIMEAVRRDLNSTSLDNIKEVYLERSGTITLIKE